MAAQFAEVGYAGTRLEIIDDAPDYAVAHPLEANRMGFTKCHKCALSVRPDTGEIVLLWLCGGINWSVSRETPDYERHRDEIAALAGVQ